MDISRTRDELAETLAGRKGLEHLRVKKYGATLIIYSGPGDDEQKHARLTHIGGTTWGLSFPLHTGRWEKTPFTGTISEQLDTLTTNFPFYLEHH